MFCNNLCFAYAGVNDNTIIIKWDQPELPNLYAAKQRYVCCTTTQYSSIVVHLAVKKYRSLLVSTFIYVFH